MSVSKNVKESNMSEQSLFNKLGGHESIVAFVETVFSRVVPDPLIGRYWKYRGTDGIKKEKELGGEFFTKITGGNSDYSGRDMKTTHKGMQITEKDWSVFCDHVSEVMKQFGLPLDIQEEVEKLISVHKNDIVEL
jgi:hemoglobin